MRSHCPDIIPSPADKEIMQRAEADLAFPARMLSEADMETMLPEDRRQAAQPVLMAAILLPEDTPIMPRAVAREIGLAVISSAAARSIMRPVEMDTMPVVIRSAADIIIMRMVVEVFFPVTMSSAADM